MDVDKEVLIVLVFNRPALWDKRHMFHSNRNVTSKCWNEISLEMKQDENILRKRWRYLRDQFAVEFGKIPPSHSSNEAVSVCRKWPYFKSLLFLKDVVKPRSENLFRSKFATSVHINQDNQTIDSQSSNDYGQTPSSSPRIQEDDVESVQSTSPCRPTKKRAKLSFNYNTFDKETLLRAKEVSPCNRPHEDDENLLFFKSLLPHVNKIPSHLRLSFRNRIQDVVEEFAYRSRFNGASYSSTSNYSNLSGNSRRSTPETYRQSCSTLVAQYSRTAASPAETTAQANLSNPGFICKDEYNDSTASTN